jgi:hypothetical protein
MAENTEGAGEAARSPEAAQPNSDANSAKSELPEVDSPALSPGGSESEHEPATDAPAAAEPETVADSALIILPPASGTGAQSPPPRFRLRPRHKRHAVLAGSVAAAAVAGVLFGRLLGGFVGAPGPDSAALKQQQAMQQSIGALDKEVASLKASLAASRKSAKSEIAKITDRLRSAPLTTGSIPTTPSAARTPIPRPAPRHSSRVVPDWTIHDVYGGYVYVKGRGDIYQAARGAPLPGLGPIEAIKRRDGRWVVVTPKGLIVARRDRHYFETH